jgi:hypothetical protein
MPNLSSIDDPEALENRYVDKTIIYVEGEPDEEVFRRIVGPEIADRLEFKTPKSGGAGYLTVLNRVRNERPSNRKIYGLVDGEAAVTVGGLHVLLDCRDLIFAIPDCPEADGIIFLAGHELENVMMLYGGLVGHICNDVRLRDLNSLSEGSVTKQVLFLTRRFFNAALLKYAALQLTWLGQECSIVEAGRFQAKCSAMSIRRDLRNKIAKQGIPWDAFSAQIYGITRHLRKHFKMEALDEKCKSMHLMRLADGKGLLTKLQSHYKSGGRWEGHLVQALTEPRFAVEFRTSLMKHSAT